MNENTIIALQFMISISEISVISHVFSLQDKVNKLYPQC